MYRVGLTISFVLFMVACDQVVRTSLRLPRAPATADSIRAQPNAMRTDPIAAVERLALAYGLHGEAQFPKECAREWRSGPYSQRRPPMRLYICVKLLPEGGLEVQLSELLTPRWSPRGDSLRRALADSLARFGAAPSQ
jgi:hypothetical protein